MNNISAPYAAFTTKGNNGLLGCLTNEVVIINGDYSEKAVALWDTGASCSCISNELAQSLNLIPIGKRLVLTPTGSQERLTYCISIGLPNRVMVQDVIVNDSEIGAQNLGVLIGMDIITIGDFAVSNYNGVTKFSFRYPSYSHIDFVEESNKRILPAMSTKYPRNSPCPCGSGKKYKQCCGK